MKTGRAPRPWSFHAGLFVPPPRWPLTGSVHYHSVVASPLVSGEALSSSFGARARGQQPLCRPASYG
eukprot:3659606-Lingulodinium_polyedra.AAC.1